MSETASNAKPPRPSHRAVEDAIKHVELRTEDVEHSSGIVFQVGELLILAQAARWALELVDFDNPPASAEELAQMRRVSPDRVLKGRAKIHRVPEPKKPKR